MFTQLCRVDGQEPIPALRSTTGNPQRAGKADCVCARARACAFSSVSIHLHIQIDSRVAKVASEGSETRYILILECSQREKDSLKGAAKPWFPVSILCFQRGGVCLSLSFSPVGWAFQEDRGERFMIPREGHEMGHPES